MVVLKRERVLSLVAVVIAVSFALAGGEAATLARRLDVIFEPTRVERAALARDGRHVAFAGRDGEDVQILIYETSTGESVRLGVDVPAGLPVQSLLWVANDRLGVAIGGTALLVLDVDARVVLKLDDAKSWMPTRQKRTGRPVVRVVAPAVDDILTVEVRWESPDGEGTIDLIRLNAHTLERELVDSHRGEDGMGWLVDGHGRPRVWCAMDAVRQRYQLLAFDGFPRGNAWLDRLVEGESAQAWQVTPGTLIGERAFPLGFAGDPFALYFASNVGRDTYGVYTLDVRTGRPNGFAVEDPEIDLADFMRPWAAPVLAVDRARGTLAGIVRLDGGAVRWLDPELAEVHSTLSAKFSDREIDVIEWDDARERFLIRVRAATDAGRYFVYDRNDGRCVEYQRNPLLPPDQANRVERLEFTTTGGDRITGTLTCPAVPAQTPLPFVIWFHNGPLEDVRPEFHRNAQALAAAGFAVAQINYRGSAGFGRRHRESIREAFDRVPLDDARALVATLDRIGRIDARRVALVGEGFGGYLALRGVQNHGDAFRAAVAINAPLDLEQLYRREIDFEQYRRSAEQRITATSRSQFGIPPVAVAEDPSSNNGDVATVTEPSAPVTGTGGAAPLSFDREFARWYFSSDRRRESSVIADVEALSRPVMFMHDPRLAQPSIGPVKRLRETLNRRKQIAELVELPPALAQGAPEARIQSARTLADFLSRQLAVSE